jgi:hypothetical protein
MGQAELALEELSGWASGRAMSVVLPLYVVMKDGQREQGQFGEVKLTVWMASAASSMRLTAGGPPAPWRTCMYLPQLYHAITSPAASSAPTAASSTPT